MRVILPVVRETPTDWASLVREALEDIEVRLPRPVEDSLMALNAYAKMPTSTFASITSSLKDARVYAALLISLDVAIIGWPSILRERIRGSEIERGGSKVTRCRPLVEAVIVLYNAAAENLEAGLSNLSLTNMHVRQSCTTPGYKDGVSKRTKVHPNVNARNAYRHFQYAHALAIDAAGFLSPSDDGNNANVTTTLPRLSIYEVVQLKSLLEVQELQTLVALCIAVSKYVFILTDSMGQKSDVLAKLAFAAASLNIPEKLADTAFPEIHLLPSALLAAYHSHEAEYYYKVNPKLPDMARVLGHINYADEILREIQRRFESSNFRKNESESTNTMKRITLSLGKLLWGKFIGQGKKKASDLPEGRYKIEEPESDKATSQRAFIYNKLLQFLFENDCVLTRIFPLVVSLVHRVYGLYKQYHHENDLVYLEKPLSGNVVQLEVPDSAVVELSLKIPAIEGNRAAPLTSFIDSSMFKDMVQGPELNAVYSKKKERESYKVSVLNECTVIENIVSELHAVELPHEVQLCIEALKPCLCDNVGSVATALRIAETILQQAWKEHESAAQLWLDAEKKRLGTKARLGFHEVTIDVEKELETWCKSLEAAESEWLSCIGPLDFGKDIEELVYLLLPPGCREARAYIQEAEDAVAKTRKDLQSTSTPIPGLVRSVIGEDASSQKDLLLLEKRSAGLRQLAVKGEKLLGRIREVMQERSWWEKREAAMRHVVLVIWDGPELKKKLTKATRFLEYEWANMSSTCFTSSSLSHPLDRPCDDDTVKPEVTEEHECEQRRREFSFARDNKDDSASCYHDIAKRKGARTEKMTFPHISERDASPARAGSSGENTDNNRVVASSELQAEVSTSLKARLRKNQETVQTRGINPRERKKKLT